MNTLPNFPTFGITLPVSTNLQLTQPNYLTMSALYLFPEIKKTTYEFFNFPSFLQAQDKQKIILSDFFDI